MIITHENLLKDYKPGDIVWHFRFQDEEKINHTKQTISRFWTVSKPQMVVLLDNELDTTGDKIFAFAPLHDNGKPNLVQFRIIDQTSTFTATENEANKNRVIA